MKCKCVLLFANLLPSNCSFRNNIEFWHGLNWINETQSFTNSYFHTISEPDDYMYWDVIWDRTVIQFCISTELFSLFWGFLWHIWCLTILRNEISSNRQLFIPVTLTILSMYTFISCTIQGCKFIYSICCFRFHTLCYICSRLQQWSGPVRKSWGVCARDGLVLIVL